MKHTEIYHGEFCSCGNCAKHKIIEDGDFVFDKPGQVVRHPFTAYVCCRCFSRLFGPVAAEWCGTTNHSTGPVEPSIDPDQSVRAG